MYTITIKKIASGYSNTTLKTLEIRSFETRKDAKAEISKMVKNEGFVKHYNYYNAKEHTELHLNF